MRGSTSNICEGKKYGREETETPSEVSNAVLGGCLDTAVEIWSFFMVGVLVYVFCREGV